MIDTGKYLKPLGRVSRRVNNQAYEARFHLLSLIIILLISKNNKRVEHSANNETVNAASLKAFTNCL